MKLKTEKVMKNNLKKSFNLIPWDNLRKNSLGINQGFKKRWGSQYGSTENSFPFKSSSISSATYFPAPADRINLKKYFQFSLDISRVNSENYSFLIIIRVDSGIFLCDSYLQIDNSRKKWNIYWQILSRNSRIWKFSVFSLDVRVQRLSVEIKPKICKLVKNLFRPFHMKEHVRIIDKNQKSGPRPRNLRRRNPFLFFWL